MSQSDLIFYAKIFFKKEIIFADHIQKASEKFVEDFHDSLSSEDDPETRSDVLKSILQSKYKMNILSGPPGSAKTYLAAQAMQFYDSINFPVFGLSLSQQAVLRLSEKSQQKIYLIDDFLKNTHVIPERSVVFIDEAGLIDESLMIKILQAAVDQSWEKLVLMGDYRQETPKEGGVPLITLEKEFPKTWFRLKTGFRQKTDFQRQFMTQLYQSDTEKALKSLMDHDGIIWAVDAYATMDEAVMTYLKWRSHDENYKKTGLILTQDRNVAKAINEMVQSRILTFSNKVIWPLINQSHALDIHDAQGLAIDHSFVAMTKKLNGQTMISACSRHRYGLNIIVNQAVYSDLDSLVSDAKKFTD